MVSAHRGALCRIRKTIKVKGEGSGGRVIEMGEYRGRMIKGRIQDLENGVSYDKYAVRKLALHNLHFPSFGSYLLYGEGF